MPLKSSVHPSPYFSAEAVEAQSARIGNVMRRIVFFIMVVPHSYAGESSDASGQTSY